MTRYEALCLKDKLTGELEMRSKYKIVDVNELIHKVIQQIKVTLNKYYYSVDLTLISQIICEILTHYRILNYAKASLKNVCFTCLSKKIRLSN